MIIIYNFQNRPLITDFWVGNGCSQRTLIDCLQRYVCFMRVFQRLVVDIICINPRNHVQLFGGLLQLTS